jgi:hypothetical protein
LERWQSHIGSASRHYLQRRKIQHNFKAETRYRRRLAGTHKHGTTAKIPWQTSGPKSAFLALQCVSSKFSMSEIWLPLNGEQPARTSFRKIENENHSILDESCLSERKMILAGSVCADNSGWCGYLLDPTLWKAVVIGRIMYPTGEYSNFMFYSTYHGEAK